MFWTNVLDQMITYDCFR